MQSLYAFELKNLTINSYLNSPLDLSISIYDIDLDEKLDEISIKLSGEGRYNKFGIDRPAFIEDLKISVGKNKADPRDLKINIISSSPISQSSFLLLLELIHGNELTTKSIPVTLYLETVSGDYQIQSGDTLWSIAFKNRPGDDLSMDQTMIAFYQMNYEFFAENIDDIKQGVVKIPTRDFISQIESDSTFNTNDLSLYKEQMGERNVSLRNDLINQSNIENILAIKTTSVNNIFELTTDSQIEASVNTTSEKEDRIETPPEVAEEVQEGILEKLDTKPSLPVKVIYKKSNSNFNQIIEFIDTFWALLSLSIALIAFIVWSILSRYKSEKSSVIELEQSIAMNEIATKLDLARAYVDMGEPDGAYEILEEVLEHGDKSQKQLAKKLIKTLNR
jgi:FimV-like protein